jgi:TctA family transporter
MAILIGAFVMLGIQPGPHIALTGMDLVWSLIWALALANFLSVFVFLAMAPAFSLLVFVRGALLIPFVIVLAFLGAYLSESHWQNMLVLAGIGVLGYFLKKYGWPRPPFVIGLVLGAIAEDSIHKALAIWGPTFFLRPLSLVFIALIVLTVVAYIWKQRKAPSGVHYDI